jgi:hypothetical protein
MIVIVSKHCSASVHFARNQHEMLGHFQMFLNRRHVSVSVAAEVFVQHISHNDKQMPLFF